MNQANNNRPVRVAIYIDGFNFYYWLKTLPYRWVNLETLALNAISQEGKAYDIVAVKYFTARVSDTHYDRTKSTRQDIYFQALKASIPRIQFFFGEFRRNARPMPKANRDGTTGAMVWVMDTEEKGSDVNLAVELLNDAWSDVYDLALVISNDSDLERAVRLSKKKQRSIGVLIRGDANVHSLKRVATFVKILTEPNLRASLMPQSIPNTTIRIPEEWALMEKRAGIR